MRTRLATSASISPAPTRERGERRARVNVLPSTDASCSRPRSSSGTASSREAISACRVSGTSSDDELAGDRVTRPLRRGDRGRAASARSRRRRAESLRPPAKICVAQVVRQSRDEAVQQLVHRLGQSGSSGSVVALRCPAHPGWRSATSGRASVSTKIGWCATPVEQVLEEVERALASAHWMSSTTITSGPSSASRSKKRRQAAKRSSRSGALRSARPSSWRSRGSIDARSSGSVTCCSSVAHELLRADVAASSFSAIRRAATDHLRERPERDAVAVGEAAAAVPPDVSGKAVDVLLELPRQAGLADPGDADDRDDLRPPSSAVAWKRSLTRRSSRVASDERRLEPGGTSARRAAPATTRSACQSGDRLRLALELVLTRVREHDRGFRGAAGRLADQDRARLRGGLDAGGGVDEVAGDHPLAVGPERDRGLAGEHAGAGRVEAPASSVGTAATSSSAARTARSASSSFATGAPQTAITASPMNFSTVPPYRSISARQSSK